MSSAIRTHVLGFPRSSANREMEIAIEEYWHGNIESAQLMNVAREQRQLHWSMQHGAGLDFITVGDFALHDHVLDHIHLLGCEPRRFNFKNRTPNLQQHFEMVLGASKRRSIGRRQASEAFHMLEKQQWFSTDYYYYVPEFEQRTIFDLSPHRLMSEIAEAQTFGYQNIKPTILGPLTFLYLGKEIENKENGENKFDRLQLLDALLPAYIELLSLIAARGIEWVQIEEPILGLDLPPQWSRALERTYHALQRARIKILLTTYFGPLANHICTTCKLPIAGLHIDTISAPAELRAVLDWLPNDMTLSLGLIDERGVTDTNIEAAMSIISTAQRYHRGPLWIAPSCSLLHAPRRISDDQHIGVSEKLNELASLKHMSECKGSLCQSA